MSRAPAGTHLGPVLSVLYGGRNAGLTATLRSRGNGNAPLTIRAGTTQYSLPALETLRPEQGRYQRGQPQVVTHHTDTTDVPTSTRRVPHRHRKHTPVPSCRAAVTHSHIHTLKHTHTHTQLPPSVPVQCQHSCASLLTDSLEIFFRNSSLGEPISSMIMFSWWISV